MPSAPRVRIVVTDPEGPEAVPLIRDYLADVIGSWHGRPATAAEVDTFVRDEPASDLQGSTGTFLVAYADDLPVGCAGLRASGDDFGAGIGVLTKVYTRPSGRGLGIGRALVECLESDARCRGLTELRLWTRSDLVAACTLYERLGYLSVGPFEGQVPTSYTDRWYRKPL